MKFKPLLLSILCLLPSTLFANWQHIGKADYNWGPFHVYSISLYTETGAYQENQWPLMLSFKFAKPVEGKNFAITLIKEIDTLKMTQSDTAQWLGQLQKILPDFSPNDSLSYIALENKGYFVLNDTILNYEFDAEFNRTLSAIWLSPNSNYKQLREQLLDKSKGSSENPTPQPETAPLNEENADPQLPPNYKLQDRKNEIG
ncbi:MAG TPA: hypothetical protein DD638_06520 [Pasteurellaceae bacterium]|nr:hypothetical protein [Pasteurellaceae bacterium]